LILREIEKRHYGKYILAILLQGRPGEWMSGKEVASRFTSLCKREMIVNTSGAVCRGFDPDYLRAEVGGHRRGVLVECARGGDGRGEGGKPRIGDQLFRIRSEFYEPVGTYCTRLGLRLVADAASRGTEGPNAVAPPAESAPQPLGAPGIPPGTESADDAEAVRIFYRELLYREATPEEVLSQLAHNPEHFSRMQMLRIILRSWESAHVVAPLREIVREIYHSVLHREPAAAEIRCHVNSVREQWGEPATVRAIRSGRVWNLLNIRSPDVELWSCLGSADPGDTVRVLYRRLLYREPIPEEVAAQLSDSHEDFWQEMLHRSILDSWEHEHVVAPLREVVRETYRAVVLREPTETEIHDHVNLARGRCGTDAATVHAIRSGRARSLLGIRPLNVELDITNRCNLRCTMCLHSHPLYYRRRRHDLASDVFRRIAESIFPVTRSLSLSYGAESLLHPGFPQFVKVSAEYCVPRIGVNTNGLCLTESMVEAMVEHGLHHLGVSLDAATPETYDGIRIGGDFRKVMDNLRMVRRVRERTGSPTPQVALLFVLMRSNVRELPAFVELANDVGAASIVAVHMSPYRLLDNADQAATFDKALCNQMVHEARTRAEGYGITLVAPSDFADEGDAPTHDLRATAERFDLATAEGWERDAPCPFPWHFMAIDMQGDMVPCGWWYDQDPMGNVHRDGILAVWRSDRYQELRDEMINRRLREVCRTCPAAGMGDPNSPSAFLAR
jgi:radical SAM protein with 4Fe4S-binding SPASM domain